MDYVELAGRILEHCGKKGLKVYTMESITGGALANAFILNSGASKVFNEGRITYTNMSKIINGVSSYIIHTYTEYSKECAQAMAWEMADNMDSIGVSTTGMSEGDTPLVYIGVCLNSRHNKTVFAKLVHLTSGNREGNIQQAVEEAIYYLGQTLNLW